MGMYDNIKCEYPLPDSGLEDLWFQTKSFECMDENYTITREGRLVHHRQRWESVPEKERPYWGTPEWNRVPLMRWAGAMRSVPLGDEEVDFTGVVIFYVYTGGVGAFKPACWYEYMAEFDGGQLVQLKRNRRYRRDGD